MKQKIKKIFENAIWWSGVIMVGLILGISLQFVRAWTEPTVAPPGGNVGAPINTGANQQLKGDFLSHIGSLGLAGVLETFGFKMPTGAGVGKVLTSDATGIGTWQPPSGGGGGLKMFIGATGDIPNGAGVGGYAGGDQKCRDKFGNSSRMCMAADFALGRPNATGWFNTFVTDLRYSNDAGGSNIISSDCRAWSTNAGWGRGSIWDNTNGYINKGNCNDPYPILCCGGS